MLAIFFLYALSASSLTIGRAIFDYAQPFFFLATRMIGVGALLVLFSYFYQKQRTIYKEDYKYFFLMAAIHIFLAFGLELVALQSMQSNQVALLYNLSPFITALCSYFYFAEIITPKKMWGMVLAFCAFLPGILLQDGGIQLGSFVSWAHVAILGAVIATVYGWIIMRLLLDRGYSPSLINGIGMLGGGFLSLLTSYFHETWMPVPVTSWSQFMYCTILIALLNDLLFYNFYSHLLKKYTATFLSFAGFSLPFIAAFFGVIFLGESITWYFIFSAIMVSIGLGMFYYEEIQKRNIV